MKTRKFPRYIYNHTSLVGLVVAVIAGASIVLSLAFQASIGETNPYMGILVYTVLPPFLFLGRYFFDLRGDPPDVPARVAHAAVTLPAGVQRLQWHDHLAACIHIRNHS